MSSKDSLTILEALENLNVLLEADTLEEIEVSEGAQLISHKEEKKEPEVYWVSASRDDLTEEAIKKTFRTVLHYLQSFYRKMKETGDNQRLVEGINTIMVLVGEATRKVNRYSSLFKEKVSDFDEYKELQNFYRNKVIKETYKEFSRIPLPKESIPHEEMSLEEQNWEREIEELIGKEEVEEIQGIHLLNEVEVVKNDHLYDLFYIKNEAGHPFYTYELARNVKLACDFGEYAQEYFGDDPLLQIKNWEDKSLHLLSKKILSNSKRKIDKFYKQALQYKEMDLVMTVHNALMALMLASNPRNLIRQFSLKGCHLYFADFQMFLREALLNRDYQKFILYSPPASQPFFIEMIDLIHSLCYDLFTIGLDETEVTQALISLIERSGTSFGNKISEKLNGAYHALVETLKKHPNGPLFKAVDLIRQDESELRAFDPLMQGNIPSYESDILLNGAHIKLIRIPCPISQEFINQAHIIDEFKAYLQACLEQKETSSHLIINFQDRTSWKEHARCIALEELAKKAEFANVLTVVTMAKDTDFYNQVGIYKELDEAQEFISQFYDHLGDENTGYAFPINLKKELFPDFAHRLLSIIHKSLFDEKEKLSFRERLDFIELTYHFFTLKLIELVHPESLSLLSKDSLDIGGASSAGLILLLGIGTKKAWSAEDLSEIYRILFAPTLLVRERAVRPERFERLHDMIRILEDKKGFLTAFAPLFKKSTLSAKIHFPSS